MKAIEFDSDPEFKSTFQLTRLFGLDTRIKLKILELNELVLKLDKSSYKAFKQYEIDTTKQFEKLSSPDTFAVTFASYPTIELKEKFITEARIKATIIGIAVERYRLKNHRLPKQLAQLVPEFIKKLPNDPITDRPFRYVVGNIEQCTYSANTENYPASYKLSKTFDRRGDPVTLVKCPGWMVYSYSLDMDDDKGIPRWIQQEGSGDIPFRCVRKKSSIEHNDY